ncbi:MAG: helix-turn-helix transcriptional regulator [Chloroflexi bacterium]|nr:helix-turn-helix transcriptional regulator [Chloroflexota bacterium]
MKLEVLRKSRLFTQQSLAEQANTAVSTIYLIEAGRTTPRFNIIRKLCAALKVEPHEVDEFQAALQSTEKSDRRKGKDVER